MGNEVKKLPLDRSHQRRGAGDGNIRLAAKTDDADDHIGSWLTFLAMLTGCLAMQESHDSLRAIHMLVVEIWLIYFPFSRLMHAVTFVFSRGYTGAFFGRRGVSP